VVRKLRSYQIVDNVLELGIFLPVEVKYRYICQIWKLIRKLCGNIRNGFLTSLPREIIRVGIRLTGFNYDLVIKFL
jgi:hypothetical protein